MKKLLLILYLMFSTLSYSQDFTGTWKITPEAGAFGVGPGQGNMGWFSNSAATVSQRACFFDDEYIFNADGSFQNVLGSQTWLEGWQGQPEGCGTPVAPHDGSNPATWAFNSSNNTLTITGIGAFLGIAKAYNGGELSSPQNAPSSITYIVSSQSSTSMTLDINVGGAAWWRFKLTKANAIPTCNDGIQNGTETGVDCGGTCSACPDNTPPASNPTIAASSAITIYSDSGTLVGTAVPINTFRTGWSSASLNEVLLSGNATLKYTNLGFVGIEATSNPINATNMNTFHLDVYTPTATTFAVKLVDFGANGLYGGGDDTEHQVAFNTQVGWNSKDILLSTFTGLTTRANIAQIIFVGTGTAYVDNIYFKYEEIQIPTAPLIAAPTPPARNAWDVISFFSDAYTNQGANFNPNWGQSTIVTQEQIEGNATMKYTNLNYQGVQFNSGVNVANMTKLHIDVWTPNADAFEVFLIGGGENGVTLYPSQAGWNSFDIDMSNYAARTLTNIIQFKFVGTPFGSSTIFYDNLYFWRPESSLPPPTISGFSIPNKFVGDEQFQLVNPTSNSNGAFSYTSSNTQVATVSGDIVTIIGAGTTVITATQAASSNYGTGTITASFVVSFPPPTVAATTPTISSGRVLSVFSDAYTNVTNTNFFPYWGQNPTVIGSSVLIDNNNTLKYERLSYQGIQLASSIDVSEMTTLHLDIWTPDCTSFDVFLINPGIREQKVTVIPSTSGWNNFAISLEEYTNIDLTNVGQFKFVATPTGSTVYLDNIYFSKPCSPNITSQPASPTICRLNGATASISAAAAAAQSPSYQWQVQSPTATTWANISNNQNYSGVTSATLNITRTSSSVPATGTKYRVILSSCGASVTSNQVTLTELTTLSKAATISAKSISNSSLSPVLTTCNGTSVNLTLAAGSVGNVQWEMSTTSATAGFSPVGSLIEQSALSAINPSLSFTTPVLTQDTWFRVRVSNGVCSSVTSAAIKITVSTTPTAGTIAGGNVTVCAPLVAPSTTVFDASGSALSGSITNSTTLSLSGNTPGTTIVWQRSTNYVNTTNAEPVWSTVTNRAATTPTGASYSGAGTSELVVGNLAATTWFRARVINGACSVTTDVVSIEVSRTARAGAVTSPTTVCAGGNITFNSAAYTGSAITWEVSTTSATSGFSAIAGANGLTFTMNNVTLVAPGQKFYVRSVVTSGDCTLARSAVRTVTVDRSAVATLITGNVGVNTQLNAICTNATRTLTLGAGYVGTIQWQQSYDNINFTDITGATLRTFSASSSIEGNVWFRVKMTSGPCSVVYSTPVNVWFKSCSQTREDDLVDVKSIFTVKGYPNPYNANFMLSLETPSESMVYITVYDMAGRLIENREVTSSALEGLQLGSDLASGVYNVIVAQDNNVKTIRMVKKE